MNLNIQKLREETPGCRHVLHFNNAGAALPTVNTLNAVKEYLDLEATKGGYEAAVIANETIQRFYHNAAQLLNCIPDEIAFTENATRAWDMAFYSLKLEKGDKILTSVHEYVSNYLALIHKTATTGVSIEIVANDASGQIDLIDLESKIDPSVKLIAITHVPTNGGLINPAAEIGKIAKKHGVFYMLDATQSIGQMPIDVKQIGCDFLCATGRKFLRGPRGTGFLYVNSKVIAACEPPFVDLQAALWTHNNCYQLSKSAQRFESWEHYVAGKIGLSSAIDYLLKLDLKHTWARIQTLSELLRTQLKQIPALELHDQGTNQCGIITFTHPNKSSIDIQTYLLSKGINVSVSLLEYARIDMTNRGLNSLVRASVHYYNNEEEVARFCTTLENYLMART